MVFIIPRPPGPTIISGSESDDVLIGTDSFDVIFANGGSDRVFAGGGNDSVVLDLDGRLDFIDGGSGVDTLSYWQVDKGMTIDLNAGVSQVNAQLVSTSTPFGTLSYVVPGYMEDRFINIQNVTGGSGDDIITGNGSDNLLFGAAGNDTLSGGAGEDHLQGGSGNDILSGGADNDQLYGDMGDNIISGGAGNDDMYGGRGSDTFKFTDEKSNPLNLPDKPVDWIWDFAKGHPWRSEADTIDLSGIDANTKMRGDQSFDIVDSFSGRAGELALNEEALAEYLGVDEVPTGSTWQLWQGDTNGDGLADFSIMVQVTNLMPGALTESDFIL